MHPSVAHLNVSVSTSTFAAQLRGSRPAPGASSAAGAARGLRVNALSTYNRRGDRTAMSAVLATHRAAAPQQASAITRASLARLSHVARPRFNALQRLASHALSTKDRGRGSTFSVSAAVAVAAHDAATVQRSQPSNVAVSPLHNLFSTLMLLVAPKLPHTLSGSIIC